MSSFEVLPPDAALAPVQQPAAAPQQAPAARTVADRLRARSVETLRDKHETFPIPARTDDGLAMAYRSYLSREQLDGVKETFKGDLTGQDAQLLVIQCVGLVVDGQLHYGDDGQPLTFTSRALQEMVGVTGAHDAVKALYIHDGDVARTVAGVLRLTGWSGTAPLDPTRA